MPLLVYFHFVMVLTCYTGHTTKVFRIAKREKKGMEYPFVLESALMLAWGGDYDHAMDREFLLLPRKKIQSFLFLFSV